MALRRRRGAGPGRHRGGRAGLVALALATYLAAGLVATLPALREADDSFLAQGLRARGETAPGDHLQTVWQLWLPGHQLERGAAPWLDPYSFQPEVDRRPNFAGWPFGLAFWPLYALLGAVMGWNAFVLLSFVGAGAFTFLWLRELGLGPEGALAGGLSFALAPYLVTQGAMGHLLAPVSMLLPLSLYALERSRVSPGGAWVVLAAAALASIPLSGQVHLALGAVPFFVLYALLRPPVRLAVVAGCALTAVFSALAVYVAAIRGSVGGGGRSFEQVERYSAELLDFLARDPRHGLESAVFLGWLLPLVALVGVVALVLQGRYRLVAVLLVGAVLPCVLALGATLPGYREVWERLPGLGETRVPARLMPIACLSLAGLAGAAADRARRPLLVAALLILLALDLRLGVTRYRPSAADPDNGAYAALRDEGPGRLLELPVHLPDRQEGSVYLHNAMQAPRERPAGYSTTAPKEADAAVRKLREDPCSARELGVRYLAVFEPAARPCSGTLIGEDGPVVVFRLRQLPQAGNRRR